MTNKEEYRLICEQQGANIPIYSQYWWMEAVCVGKEWDVVIAKDANGKVMATMPYLHGKKALGKYILMPPLTQTNGICYNYPELRSEHDRLSFEKQAANLVIAEIEKLGASLFIQNFAPQFTNWLPFRWAGYKQSTRYTYRISDISNPDAVFAQFSSAKQRQIRKAEKNNLRFEANSLNPEEFYSYHESLILKRKEKEEIDKTVFLSLAKAAITRNQGAILSIRGAENELQAALFLVWDETTAYYLVPANDRHFSTTGASTLLVWEAIKYSQSKSKSFDFEGSMEEGIENSYNQFGTAQTPYFQITKASTLLARLWGFFNL